MGTESPRIIHLFIRQKNWFEPSPSPSVLLTSTQRESWLNEKKWKEPVRTGPRSIRANVLPCWSVHFWGIGKLAAFTASGEPTRSCRMTQSQRRHLWCARTTRLDVATHEKPFHLRQRMHGRMHFNHGGYRGQRWGGKWENRKQFCSRHSGWFLLPAAPRMTYWMQVIFSIDFLQPSHYIPLLQLEKRIKPSIGSLVFMVSQRKGELQNSTSAIWLAFAPQNTFFVCVFVFVLAVRGQEKKKQKR